ncbi:unnamed protein product [Arabis nemorensis]|uniref:NAC domain-containing protein n=1 Tax=Arabis nemorensis TaxID=586526 RepID=A0A565AMK9_9BRAS|nr:unnamed protein product [Arabis nemorensis]
METLSIGERFDPTKSELVEYLRNKVQKGKNGYITDMDVYEDEPWLLQHLTRHPQFMEREWFYFVPTTQGGGSKPKRTVPGKDGECEGGTWRSIGRERKRLKENKVVIGYKQSFVYYKKLKGNPQGKRTDWFMKEFSLCDDELQDWVLCRIRHKPSEKKESYEQKEEDGGLLGLADEFGKTVLEEQETPILLPQGQDSGFETTTQSSNNEWWDDLIYEQIQKLPEILQAQDSRGGFVDQGLAGGDMMMHRSTNPGFEWENSGCICATPMTEIDEFSGVKM